MSIKDKSGSNIFLADLIYIFHILIILFMVITPFYKFTSSSVLVLHIAFGICLLTHWYTNSNECSLTYIEAKLRGLKKESTFIHQFIGPIYDISNDKMVIFAYCATLLLICVSIFRLTC